ncbi:unnamed protein product [Sphagnum balticum]
MSGTEDRDVYRVEKKFVRPRKPDERIRIRSSKERASPRTRRAIRALRNPTTGSCTVKVCEDCPRRRPRAECFWQLRLKSAPAPAYSRSA